MKWDDEQLEVIESDPDARILVEAGPGTGKTAVACGRVACLVDLWEIEPANVLLLSFTRTAVAEMRNRIGGYIGDEHRAAAIKISTLDSTVWHLIYGFDQNAADAFGGYEANIETVLRRLEAGDPDLLDHLARYQHVIVDEAQDLTSVRARLVIALIKALDTECGVTVFADPHQAIYGFTTDSDDDDDRGTVTFLDLLHQEGALKFRGLELKTLHRTGDSNLALLMSSLRDVISRNGSDAEEQHVDLKSQLQNLAGSITHTRTDLPQHANGQSDLLILYRRRAEVLATSAFFCSEAIPHRLRLSGLPACVQPWVARIFFDCSTPTMRLDEFRRRWSDRKCAVLSTGTIDDAIAAIRRVTPVENETIDVRQLRSILARSRPPAEFCNLDCVPEGPILGTIHASKGREAETVYLFVSDDVPEDAVDEESRVVYVGATRAKKNLCVSTPGRIYAKSLDRSGRVYSIRRDKRSAQVEIGRDGDLVVSATVSTRLHPTQEDALAVQELLASSANETMAVTAHSHPDWDYRYRLRFEGGPGTPWISELAPSLNQDLFSIIKLTGNFMRPPACIKHLFSVSTRTVVLNHDHPDIREIHNPFRVSGFFLAPVIRAWTVVYFQFRRSKGRVQT